MIGLIGGIRTAANVLVMFAAPHLKRKVGMPVMMVASGLFMLEAMLFQICNSTLSILLICMLDGAAMGLNFATGVNYISLMAPKGLEATSISLYAIGAPTMGIIVSAAGGQIITYFGSRAIFLLAFGAVCLWLIIFLLSFYVGRHIFKKEPPVPLLLRPLRLLRKKAPKQRRSNRAAPESGIRIVHKTQPLIRCPRFLFTECIRINPVLRSCARMPRKQKFNAPKTA